MAIDFPVSPVPGQVYTFSGITYIFSSQNVWIAAGGSAGGFTTGDVKFTLKAVADTGWVLMQDQTIGSAASGAANNGAGYQDLFNLLYNTFPDAWCPVLTGAGGATTRAAQGTSATAWTNNVRMTLPKTLGRVLGCYGSGAGLVSRALGTFIGADTETPTIAKTAAHGHAITGANVFVTTTSGGGLYGVAAGGDYSSYLPNGYGFLTSPAVSQGSGTPLDIVQATTFLNVMVKL